MARVCRWMFWLIFLLSEIFLLLMQRMNGGLLIQVDSAFRRVSIRAFLLTLLQLKMAAQFLN